MMARPVAHYLVEFGPTSLVEASGETSGGAACLDLQDEPAVEDPEVSLQAARDKGVTEGYAAARAEYAAQLLQERLAFEARLAAERDRWARQESEKLSEDIKAIFVEVESNIAGCVELALTPFVVDALRSRMIDLLAETVGTLLGGRECPIVEIHGPEDLLAMLREKLAALSGAIDYSPDDSIEVRIVADQTKIESRIGAWVERIKSLPE
ncbi:MAG: hypothetical protein ACLQFI_04430 [Methylocella sp.]